MLDLKIVTVVNDFKIYDDCIKNNEYLKDYEVIAFDNTAENVGIPKRYNTFIDTIKDEDDYWVAFLHQDFKFNEDPLKKLVDLDKNVIYGAVGIIRQLFFLQFKPKFIFKIFRRCMIGKIFQGEHEETVGNEICGTANVITFDCCCCIVHSSMLKKMRFDENLNFHMYVEDFCHTAKKLGVNAKVIQFNCRHLSGGNLNEDLDKAVKYVKQKHHICRVHSTCYK